MFIFASSACFKLRLIEVAPEGTDSASAVPRRDDNGAHQAIGMAEPAQTVDNLDEKGAPPRPIAVVTTMSYRAVPRLVTWYTAPVNSMRSARAIGRDA